ncbi:Pleckstrin homology domain-containing family J member 1, partial [Galemys pyrenaicus]
AGAWCTQAQYLRQRFRRRAVRLFWRRRRRERGRQPGGFLAVAVVPGGTMRYNEKELQALSRQPAELAAELGMRSPKKGSVVKRRLVKLVVNFLFYFRTDEAEPVGALLLEHCRVTQEEPCGFSISFLEDPDRKYHFECCNEEQCQEWMGALRQASYEFMRRSLIFYRNEIQKMTGKVHTGAERGWTLGSACLGSPMSAHTGPSGAVRYI